MIVIVVAQGKGGVGKTTLAVNLAGEIVRFGRSVTLIDSDPQGSATLWAEPRQLAFRVRHELLTIRNSLTWVRNVLKSGTDFIVIDTPSGFGQVFDTSVLIADLIVIPSGPSSLDITAAAKSIARVREVRRGDDANSLFKLVTVPTRVDLSTEEGHQISDELADLGETVGPSLSYDIDFVRCFTTGLSVSSLPDEARAFNDVKRLSLFLLKQVLPRRARVDLQTYAE